MTRPSTSELKRRFVHASGSALPFSFLLGVVAWWQLRLALVGLSAVVTVLEAIRLVVGLEWRIYEELTREYEQTNVAGYALYMYSMTAVALVFSPHVAVAGMLMLTVGDPISGLLGRNEVGERKRIRALVAMFAVCAALGYAALVAVAAPWRATLAALAGAGGATLADGLKPVVAGYVVDDNISIPPAACLAIAAVFAVTHP